MGTPEMGVGSSTPSCTRRRRPGRSVTSMSPPGRNTRLHGLTRPVATAETRIFSMDAWYTCGSGGRVGELRSAAGVTGPGCCAPGHATAGATRVAATAANDTNERAEAARCMARLLRRKTECHQGVAGLDEDVLLAVEHVGVRRRTPDRRTCAIRPQALAG